MCLIQEIVKLLSRMGFQLGYKGKINESTLDRSMSWSKIKLERMLTFINRQKLLFPFESVNTVRENLYIYIYILP